MRWPSSVRPRKELLPPGQGLGVLQRAPVLRQPPSRTTPRQGRGPGEGVEDVPAGHFELSGQFRLRDRDETGLPAERLVLVLLPLLVIHRDGGLHLPDERVVGVDGDVRGLGQVLEYFLGRLQQLSFTVCEGGSPSGWTVRKGGAAHASAQGRVTWTSARASRHRRLGPASLASFARPGGLGWGGAASRLPGRSIG